MRPVIPKSDGLLPAGTGLKYRLMAKRPGNGPVSRQGRGSMSRRVDFPASACNEAARAKFTPNSPCCFMLLGLSTLSTAHCRT